MTSSNRLYLALAALLVAVGLTGYVAAGNGSLFSIFFLAAAIAALATWSFAAIRRVAGEASQAAVLRRFASIPEENPNMIVEIDGQGEISFANRACRSRFGKPDKGATHPLLEGLPIPFDQGQELNVECRDELQIGDEIFERHALFAPALGVLRVYAFDITRLKKTEQDLLEAKKQAEEAARLKNVFLANMGHEIRTPLNAIIGYTDLLQMDNRNETEKKRLAVVRQAGKNLLSLINDILDLSKLESGRLLIVAEEFDPRQLIAASRQKFFQLAENRKVEFRIKEEENVPQRLIGDAGRISQILDNLLSNAFKFTEKGFVALSAEYDKEMFICRVADTGIGIPEELQRIIFAEFRQGDAADSRKYGGAGLGLSITRHLVSLMGGELLLESEPGRGSCFTVRLPLAAALKSVNGLQGMRCERVEREKLANALSRSEVGLRVLIAEDDAMNQGLLRAMLRQVGIEAEVAGNGKEALDKLAESDFDLLFLDMKMPVLDGMATIAAIRANRALSSLYVIALTGDAAAVGPEKFLDAGCDDYLAKPVELEIFYGKIYSLLVSRFPADMREADQAPAPEEPVEDESLRMSRELRFQLVQAQDVLMKNMKIFNPDQIHLLAVSFADFADQKPIRGLQGELERIAATFDDEALPRVIGKIEGWKNL